MTLVVSNWAVSITIKFSKLVYIFPNLLVRSVENMSTVLVNLNAIDFLGIDIPGNVVTLFDYLDALTTFRSFIGKGCTKEPCTNN